MTTILLHLPRLYVPRSIDITPVPWWRLAARSVWALLGFVVIVPLLALIGALVALTVLGAMAAMLAAGMVLTSRRDRAARESASASFPSRCNPTS